MVNNSSFDSAQLRKGVIEILLLLILKENESYGYRIVQKLKESGPLKINEGTIYPVLRRLEANGYITSRWVQPDNGNPRKYYKSTKDGTNLLNDAIKELENITLAISNLKEGKNE